MEYVLNFADLCNQNNAGNVTTGYDIFSCLQGTCKSSFEEEYNSQACFAARYFIDNGFAGIVDILGDKSARFVNTLARNMKKTKIKFLSLAVKFFFHAPNMVNNKINDVINKRLANPPKDQTLPTKATDVVIKGAGLADKVLKKADVSHIPGVETLPVRRNGLECSLPVMMKLPIGKTQQPKDSVWQHGTC